MIIAPVLFLSGMLGWCVIMKIRAKDDTVKIYAISNHPIIRIFMLLKPQLAHFYLFIKQKQWKIQTFISHQKSLYMTFYRQTQSSKLTFYSNCTDIDMLQLFEQQYTTLFQRILSRSYLLQSTEIEYLSMLQSIIPWFYLKEFYGGNIIHIRNLIIL